MTLLAQADAAARAYILERDRWTCQHCDKPGTDWAHIHGRGARYIRHEPDNAVTLCRGCHWYFTTHPAQWRRWIAERYGPDRWDGLLRLEAAGERRGASVDLRAVIRGFRERDLSAAEIETYRSGAWLG